MKRFTACLLFLVFTVVCPVVSSAARERPWSGMLVTGTVDINPDGKVRDYAMDHPEKIPSVVLDVIKQTVAGWRFQVQVPGHVIAHARMNLRIVAKPLGSTSFSIEVEGVDFGRDREDSGEQITERDTPVPNFPREAAQAGGAATVYILMRVGRDGRVLNVGAEEVNFTVDLPSAERKWIADAFVKSCEVTMRHWTFNVPTKGDRASDPYWLVRVPAHFDRASTDQSPNTPGYGSWEPYLPGPRLQIPWVRDLTDPTMLATAPDSMPDHGATMLDGTLKLSTPYDGG
jgi:hypothetical protein